MSEHLESSKVPAISPDEERALRAIDTDWLLETLRVLIASQSHEGRETQAQDLVAGLMVDAGLQVDRWWIDLEELRRHPAFSCEVARTEALGVVGVTGREAPAPAGTARDLILNGHIDVVPPGDFEKWTTPPWSASVRDGFVYGRGAADMKGGVACALCAARALRDAGVCLSGRLILESVTGEEDGGLGTLATIVRGYRADGAIVLEPTDLSIVLAQAGCLDFRMVVTGKAAHGALRWEGVSALDKFAVLHDALKALERGRTHELLPPAVQPLFAELPVAFPISVGTVRAGTWASSVPDKLVCEGRFGVMPGEDPAAARQQFHDALMRAAQADEWLRRHPPRVEWIGARYLAALTSPDAPIATAVSEAHAALFSRRPVMGAVTYGADTGLLVSVGGMDAMLYGPGDIRNAHKPNEYVPIQSLLDAVKAVVVTAMRFCGYTLRERPMADRPGR